MFNVQRIERARGAECADAVFFFVLTPQINNQCGLSVHCQEQEAAKLWPRERWARKGGPGSPPQSFCLFRIFDSILYCAPLRQRAKAKQTQRNDWRDGKRRGKIKREMGSFFLSLLPHSVALPSLPSLSPFPLYVYICKNVI